MATTDIENLIKSQVLEVARNVEQHLDSELEKLESMDADDMERLRVNRMRLLKEQARKRQEFLAMVCSITIYNNESDKYNVRCNWN